MEHTLEEISIKCKEADMVLIGIGEDFQYNWNILMQNERFQEIEKEIEAEEEKNENHRWIVPFLQKMALDQYPDQNLANAYKNLKKIVEGKNYFIISISMDDCVYEYGFRQDRIVTPCGGFRRMQCEDNCQGQLMEFDNKTYAEVKSYFNKELALEELHEPVCKFCNQKRRFNQIGVRKYAEEGYLPQWKTYTKWLQGTMNKKVCVIELGVDLQLPTIIRWPFERIVFYNQKSFLYRIHPALYQLGEKIGERGAGIKEKPVDFLANGFVN